MFGKKAFENEKINILIISDRLMEYSQNLYEFFKDYEDITCNLIHSISEFNSSEMGIPDFLLAAGYLKDDNNYNIVERIREINSGVFCIQLGRIDDCTIYHSQKYSFDEYFERTSDNEKLLNRLQTIRRQIRDGFEFDAVCDSESMLWNDNKFMIAAYDTDIINLRDLGIIPAGKSLTYKNDIYYVPVFSIENYVLKLKDLEVSSRSIILPELNGVKPQCKKDNMKKTYTYNSINMTLPYTGEMIIADKRVNIVKHHYRKLNTMFGWRKLIQLVFRDGEFVLSYDRKDVAQYVKRQEWVLTLKSLFEKGVNLTPLQQDFLRDYSEPPEPNKKAVYAHYMRYFDNYKLRREKHRR